MSMELKITTNREEELEDYRKKQVSRKAGEEDRIKQQRAELALKRRRNAFSETGEIEARMSEDISKIVGKGWKMTKIRILRLSSMTQQTKKEAENKGWG